MTMLNAAPTATSISPGAAVAAAAPQANDVPVAAQPVPAQHHQKARELGAEDPELHVLGSGSAAGATGDLGSQDRVTVALDQFAKRSGPDAAVQTANGVVTVHAVFQLDAKTRELSVAIVNEDGQLVRMIPPESVARMIAAMARYRGR